MSYSHLIAIIQGADSKIHYISRDRKFCQGMEITQDFETCIEIWRSHIVDSIKQKLYYVSEDLDLIIGLTFNKKESGLGVYKFYDHTISNEEFERFKKSDQFSQIVFLSRNFPLFHPKYLFDMKNTESLYVYCENRFGTGQAELFNRKRSLGLGEKG